LFSSIGDKISKVKNSWSSGILNVFKSARIDENFWEELEETLISGDVSLELTDDLIEELKDQASRKNIKESSELLKIFSDLLVEKIQQVNGMGEELTSQEKPYVIILTGVNGSGKTTSAGKLALKYLEAGKRVIFAAADTYRAAAIEQLKIWGERTGVRVIAQKHGSDPASVVFDAISAAKASDADVVIADTAGRLHSRRNLMEELSKIYRIAKKEAGESNVGVLLVLDAVMGQNGLRQVEEFNRILPLDGIILAKYDTTAKGGIILTVAEKLRVPVRYLGLGEQPQDLSGFNPESFIEALLEKRAN
jgi:fused signal recognition particle receptor